MIVYLDIETEPNPAMREYVTTSPDEAPKSYKKPESIATWVEKEQQKRLDRMALDVDARIVALSWVPGGANRPPPAYVMRTDEQEAEILSHFWGGLKGAAGVRYCGFNLLGFDLPVLRRRSWVLGVDMPLIDLRRYSTDYVIDLMQLLYNWGNGPGPKARGLKAVCEMYGIPNPLPDLDGSKVADMDDETLAAYCRNDVIMTRALAQKMRGWYWK